MARAPQPGKVKTRLAAVIGDEAALLVYQNLLNYTHGIAQNCQADVHIFFDVIPDTSYAEKWAYLCKTMQIQQGSDLGARLQHAMGLIFAMGYLQVAVVGSDCPELSSSIIQKAFATLQQADVCLGPARDGGYYLLASNQYFPCLFENISWGGPQVLAQTIRQVWLNGLSWHTLEELRDIDTWHDLEAFPQFMP